MTARQTLQASPKIKDVAAIVQSGLFDHCCDVALITLTENLGAGKDAAEAASLHYELKGAKRILAILKDLAIIPSEPKQNRIGQLNPQ